MNSQPDLYAVLGLTRAATQAEISHAYRALLRRHHPDTRGTQHGRSAAAADSALQRTLAAYAVLGDPDRRATYDQQLLHVPPDRLQRDAGSRPAYRHNSPYQPPVQAGPVHWHTSEPAYSTRQADSLQQLMAALLRWTRR
jgi:curved DNA-binding protein CbpA